MRDLFRLIAVGLMSLAIVGLAMLYTRGGDVPGLLRATSDAVADTLDGVGATLGRGSVGAAASAAPTYTLSIARPRPAAWIGLAGFPDQSEVAFPLPPGGAYVGGALDLAFDTQLAAHGDGLLTLSVNGTPRGQIVLEGGRQAHQARIELTAVDLAGDKVVLNMAARGTTTSGAVCPADATNVGSAVTLSPGSRLELASDRPIDGAAGTVLAAPGSLTLQPGGNAGDTTLAVWASQQLRAAGIEARLGPGTPGETPVVVSAHALALAGTASTHMLIGREAVAALVATAGSPLPLAAGPVGVAELGAETTVKSFRGSRRWSIPFAAAAMPSGALPETFEVRLKATPLAGANDWVVRVVLNGNLLESYRVAGSGDSLSFDVPLPAERLLPRNTLAVELVDTTPSEGVCARSPDAQAQLLPESRLVDTGPAVTAWAALVEELAAAPDLAFEAEGLSLPQANRAAELLGLILPRTAQPTLNGDAVLRLHAVGRQSAGSALLGIDAAARVVVPLSGISGPSLAVLRPGAELDAALQRLGADDVVFVVTGR